MVRTQIQLPDDLYREIKNVAKAQEWSIAEVLRRGAEVVVRQYRHASSSPWQLPKARPLGLQVPGESLRDLIVEDESRTSH